MRRLLVDTAVLAYAVGGDHPQRAACRRLVEAAADGYLELHASVELVQEFLFHRLRRIDRPTAVAQARDAADLCVLHPLDRAVMTRALDIASASLLGGRDAIHAATALLHGFSSIVSPDRDFDGVVGLERVEPTDAL